jgi:hypothetical protein
MFLFTPLDILNAQGCKKRVIQIRENRSFLVRGKPRTIRGMIWLTLFKLILRHFYKSAFKGCSLKA